MNDDVGVQESRLETSIRLAKEIGERGGAPLGATRESAMVRATSVPTDVAFRVFERLLKAHGMRHALYSILRLTDYRFISVFRLRDGLIESVAHVDREDLKILQTPVGPESASYCSYVRTGNGPFAIVDSLVDDRVGDHVKRDDLRAYCGVPIVSADGVLLGTLCHYDTVPRDPEQLNAALLARVSAEIVRLGLLELPPDQRP